MSGCIQQESIQKEAIEDSDQAAQVSNTEIQEIQQPAPASSEEKPTIPIQEDQAIAPESPETLQQKTQPSAPTPQQLGLTCKSNTKPIFTSAFTDFSKIRYFTPIGGVNVGSMSRSYIFVKTDESGNRMSAPIYAPTDATLFGIVYAYRGNKASGARAEYRLDIVVSCEVTFSFDHIAEISDRLKPFAPSTPANDTRGIGGLSVPIKAGELLGYTGGGDFLLFNYAKEVPHINPSRWTSEHNKYTDCPYDYFTEDLKKQYYAMFASAGGEKSDNPTCRSASRDVAGTLSGGWFQGDSTDGRGSRLYLASDYSRVDLVIDKDALPRFVIRDEKPSVKPEGVKMGGNVCYSDGINHAFLKLLTETQMAVGIGLGGCPSQLPAEYETWVR